MMRRTITRHVVVVAAGILLGFGVSELLTSRVSWAAGAKLNGRAADCPWSRLMSFSADATRFEELISSAAKSIKRIGEDQSLGIEQFASADRTFWIRHSGRNMPGQDLLAYLLGEHQWMIERSPVTPVGPGDVVLDCGAHVGVFTHNALKRGAARVIAFEPEPVNRECLRRNFAKEIAAGRVVVIDKGVWSSDTHLALHVGIQNSGSASVVGNEGGQSVGIELTTIDRVVSELGLPRVDFIKMDIEGAEREALKGAMQTLKRFRPRLMLDSYHRPDDMAVLPPIIRRAHPDYRMLCGPCEVQRGVLVPHVTFYE